ncbi:MAG: AEC family transporter [Butyrivibrio sp.]
MKTLSIVAPVIIMLIIGYVCKITGFIKDEGISNIKKYIAGIAIPVLVFHAVGVADYNIRTIVIFCIMMAAMVIALVVGYLTRKMVAKPFQKYYPFLITAYEGGMLCYPLYQNLCGDEYFSNIVIVDLAACVFVFGIYIGLLQMADRNMPFSPKQLGLNALKTPSFIGLVAGLILGITGLMNRFLATPAGEVYTSVKNVIVAPVNPMILICVGYSLNLKKELLKEVLKTISARLVIQMLLLAATLLIMKHFGLDKYMAAAFLIYFLSAPNFNPPNFVKDKEANQYIATVTSVYCLITIIGYIIIAALLF